MKMPEQFETERLVLRKPRMDDARAHWGKGYVPEAPHSIIEWAFQKPTIFREYATTDVENSASRRVMAKVGMQCEGILRKYILHPNISDIPRDSYMYAITK